MDFELLSTKETADYLDISNRTLERWRLEKSPNIPWIKYRGMVRYNKHDLDLFLEKHTHGRAK